MLRPPEGRNFLPGRSMSWPLNGTWCHGCILFGTVGCTCLARDLAVLVFSISVRHGAVDHLLLESAPQPEATLLGAGVALPVPPLVQRYHAWAGGQQCLASRCPQVPRPHHICSYTHTSSTCLTPGVLILQDGTRTVKRWLPSQVSSSIH